MDAPVGVLRTSVEYETWIDGYSPCRSQPGVGALSITLLGAVNAESFRGVDIGHPRGHLMIVEWRQVADPSCGWEVEVTFRRTHWDQSKAVIVGERRELISEMPWYRCEDFGQLERVLGPVRYYREPGSDVRWTVWSREEMDKLQQGIE